MTHEPTRWFAAVGAPFDEVAADAASLLVARFPAFLSPSIERVHAALDAVRALRAIDAEGTWWDVQETARESLWASAAERLGEDALAEFIGGANAADAARIEAIAWPGAIATDPTLADAAREFALLVAHQHALALAAGAADHWFVAQHSLFAAGHWLLGARGGRLVVY
jgi:hypothetical protein